jgi:hypothetical protein
MSRTLTVTDHRYVTYIRSPSAVEFRKDVGKCESLTEAAS